MPEVRFDDQIRPSGRELQPLYDSVGWTSMTGRPDVLEAAIAGSARVVTAWDGSLLVGLARVVSDGVTICYLQDVLVHPDFRRRGIGSRLVVSAFAPYGHVRQKVLLTDDEEWQRGFYESLGFAEVREYFEGRLRAFVRFDA